MKLYENVKSPQKNEDVSLHCTDESSSTKVFFCHLTSGRTTRGHLHTILATSRAVCVHLSPCQKCLWSHRSLHRTIAKKLSSSQKCSICLWRGKTSEPTKAASVGGLNFKIKADAGWTLLYWKSIEGIFIGSEVDFLGQVIILCSKIIDNYLAPQCIWCVCAGVKGLVCVHVCDEMKLVWGSEVCRGEGVCERH